MSLTDQIKCIYSGFVSTWQEDDEFGDGNDDEESDMNLVSSSCSSDLEKRVFGRRISGGMDGRELK